MSEYGMYKQKFARENEQVQERFELIRERLQMIQKEKTVPEQYLDYFRGQASYLLYLCELLDREQSGELDSRSMEQCQEDNRKLYEDIAPEHYGICYGNPDYACANFGREIGQLLAFLYRQIRTGIGYAFEGRKELLTMQLELFVAIYNLFEVSKKDEIDTKEIRQTIYWHFSDYSDIYQSEYMLELLEPDRDFYIGMIMESDLNDLTYLYRYGLPVSGNEIGIAVFLNQMGEDEIQAMADTFTEGFRMGFENSGRDLYSKKTVALYCPVGFERMMRAAVRNFEKLGLKSKLFRCAMGTDRGCYCTPVNRQFDFDHREDRALYFDKAFVERRLEVARTTFEDYKKLAADHAGPAVVEVFGEAPFAPESKETVISYSDKQQELNVYYASMSGQIMNEYIKGDETSFTIISYPLPEIGAQFEEIFAKTVELNTLDYKLYQGIQQKIIDVLDGAKEVRILGTGINRTDLTVSIHPLDDPEKQSAFENCVADVNIPVGEVFTSPVLKGTNGTLHVSEVFLNGLKYVDLEIVFKDGMIDSYTCGNFETEEENKKYIKDNVLMHHDTLPLGEFAIGTNTTAYRMGKVYQINDKLPILIAEKTGPHFAVGDTCYSHSEDVVVHNPNGKEIVAKDNEVSVLRDEDMSKAYFNCHTDITIPYEELGSITAIYPDGSTAEVIRDGRYVIPGTEALNKPLDEQ